MFVWLQTSFCEVKCSNVLMGKKAFQLISLSSINLLLLHFFFFVIGCWSACLWLLQSPVLCAAGVSAEPQFQLCARLRSRPWPRVGQSQGMAETKGLLKFKWHGCCEDIFYFFWHLRCQQEWQSVHHSLSFCRAEAWKSERVIWGIQSKGAAEFDGIAANVSEQAGQVLPGQSLKDTKTASLLMSSRCPPS